MTEQQLIDEGFEDGKKSFDFLFENLCKVFDFHKVHVAMKALDWHWHMGVDGYGIPRVDSIRNKAKELLLDAYEREVTQSSTGGFSYGYDNGELWLTFQIEEATSADA